MQHSDKGLFETDQPSAPSVLGAEHTSSEDGDLAYVPTARKLWRVRVAATAVRPKSGVRFSAKLGQHVRDRDSGIIAEGAVHFGLTRRSNAGEIDPVM